MELPWWYDFLPKKGALFITMLYQYTNIESLALILKNKTLCFSSLGIVDDPEEEVGYDDQFINLGRSIYVSCWTSEIEESIPMWEQYAAKMHGVRIGLPVMPFKRFLSEDMGKKPASGSKAWSLNVREIEKYNHITVPQDIQIKDVQYTDDESLIHPNVASIVYKDPYLPEGEACVSFGSMGIYKNTCWEFQNEVRYVLYTLPYVDDYTNKESHRKIVETLKDPNWVPDTKRLFIDLDESKLSQIEITCGPKISEGERYLLDCLLKEHKIDAYQCHDSIIKIR